jgi:hypothetical protein
MGPAVVFFLALQTIPTEPIVTKGTLSLKSRLPELRKDPEFSLWILLYLGVRKDDSAVQKLIDDVGARTPENTRSAALQALALQALDPVECRSRIAHCAQFLLDNQCADGRWDAGKPVESPGIPPPPRKQARDFSPPRILQKFVLVRRSEGAKTGESVLSRWAAWGLLACHESGMILPNDVVDKAAASWREGDHDPADVVTSLSILLHLRNRNWKQDPDIQKALDRLAIRDPRTEPASLFVFKRAMVHFGSDKLGGREWWQDGVKVLAAAQSPDGSWGSVEDTCFAAYFLHIPRINWGPFPDRK